MSNEYETLMRCVRSVRTKTDFVPKVALVLGSGLGDYASQLRVEATVDYHEIEGFPVSTVPGHTGRFVFGYVGDVPVVCMQGRVHYYEGYSIKEISAILHEKEATIGTRLDRARKKLKDKLGSDYYGS